MKPISSPEMTSTSTALIQLLSVRFHPCARERVLFDAPPMPPAAPPNPPPTPLSAAAAAAAAAPLRPLVELVLSSDLIRVLT